MAVATIPDIETCCRKAGLCHEKNLALDPAIHFFQCMKILISFTNLNICGNEAAKQRQPVSNE